MRFPCHMSNFRKGFVHYHFCSPVAAKMINAMAQVDFDKYPMSRYLYSSCHYALYPMSILIKINGHVAVSNLRVEGHCRVLSPIID